MSTRLRRWADNVRVVADLWQEIAAHAATAADSITLATDGDLAVDEAIAGGYGLVIALASGSQGAFLAQLFPAAERCSGIAIAREVNGAIVAGLTPASLV